ncbi:hypothetical protein IX83_03190 [Basilea psittacipulmonis DSM 24701]|uniref:Uncharacterized protein n=1 Tax=Basilea psittacipulmonis DSM 24701 TaxID=1072685 RepID=A0A077DE66_9BURK|nr:hypothetical protein IX83_03190 [Basilea psittacipulmonis DSM 24701]
MRTLHRIIYLLALMIIAQVRREFKHRDHALKMEHNVHVILGMNSDFWMLKLLNTLFLLEVLFCL